MQYGLSTAEHDRMDTTKFNQRIYQSVKSFKGKTIVDIFSGGGRDILSLYQQLDGYGQFIAIDSEKQRLSDMLAKNSTITHPDSPAFEIAYNQDDLNRIINQGKTIAAIQGEFPAKPFGNSNINFQADFILCNAGIMFIKPDDLESTLSTIANMLTPSGELALRFSLERDDKQNELGKSYFVHSPDIVQTILEKNNLKVIKHESLKDLIKRPFSWIDIQGIKT